MKQTTAKELRISWLHKLTNSEFTFCTNIICMTIDKYISSDDVLAKSYGELMKKNDKLQAMNPVERSSSLTKQIQEWHKLRKKYVVEVLVSAKTSSSEIILDEQTRNAAIVHNWMHSFGKRLYDLGINGLTSKVDAMLKDIAENESVRNAIKELEYDRHFAIIADLNKKIYDAIINRGIIFAGNMPKQSYKEVRMEVYLELQSFINSLNDMIRHGNDDELISLKHAMHYQLMQFHGPLIARKTKKDNKEKAPVARNASNGQEKLDNAIEGNVLQNSQNVYVTSNSYYPRKRKLFRYNGKRGRLKHLQKRKAPINRMRG